MAQGPRRSKARFRFSEAVVHKVGVPTAERPKRLMHWIFATSKGLILFARNEGAHFLTDCVETR
jgi:hypothetical protein